MSRTKLKSNHYVDNSKLLEALIEFKKLVSEGSSPRITPYIGECIMKIATHLAHKPNFTNYTYKADMISDGIENCLLYINNFDPKKSENPFAYFTQIIYFAFLRRIQKEKKHVYIKHAATQMAELNNMVSGRQDHDDTAYSSDLNYGEWSQEQMLRFMEEFEDFKHKRRKRVVDNTNNV